MLHSIYTNKSFRFKKSYKNQNSIDMARRLKDFNRVRAKSSTLYDCVREADLSSMFMEEHEMEKVSIAMALFAAMIAPSISLTAGHLAVHFYKMIAAIVLAG
jgi:hypothetical protein